MDSTVSVSKGCFVFKRKKKSGAPSPSQLSGELWFQSYKRCLTSFEENLGVLENRIFAEILGGVIEYIKSYSFHSGTNKDEIPAATLLTGVNMPDHASLFATLSRKVVEESSPHVATLWSRDCVSLKVAVERMCSQIMHVSSNVDMDEDASSDEDLGPADKKKIQRWNCNLQFLSSWYLNFHPKTSPSKKSKTSKSRAKAGGYLKPLVIIIPDLESFSAKVLQDFILLLKGFQNQLPFILVLGVATAVSAVHRSLPYHVSSCLRMRVFHSQPSLTYLNEVLEKIFFLPTNPFHLGGKAFKLLMDVFLFHDFSVMGFIQGYKFCMSQHFFDKNWTVLCCRPEELPMAVQKLTKADFESILKLPSVRKHIEQLHDRADRIAWLTDNNYVKDKILQLFANLHKYIHAFYTALRCLNTLTSSLPGAPLAKHLRSVYVLATTCDIVKSSEFKDSMTLLSFLSSDELESKLKEILSILQDAVHNGAEHMADVTKELEALLVKFKTLWLPSTPTKTPNSPRKSPLKSVGSPTKSPLKSPSKLLINVNSRSQLKEKLREISSQNVLLSPFEKLRTEVLSFLEENVFSTFLKLPQTQPLHELVFFDNIAAVKTHIVGSPRQALLRGLRDPHFYLDCDCCKLSDISDILPTLPDVSIVYKLHLESGKLINMYDWLQAFLTIVNPTSTQKENEVDPKLQARFTRAVAELQFLGFIKSSNRKTDHVTRLTWC